MKHTLIISLLLISVVSVLYGQGSAINNGKYSETNTDKKIAGCNNPKFKAAELAAYQDLLKAKAEAAKVLEAEITNIEQAKKDQLAKEDLKYQNDLKTCGNDPLCPGKKKVDYDDGVWIILNFAKSELVKAQKKEIAAKETAQKNYDEEVKKAIKLYCHRYKATGQTTDVVYSGVICSVERPFTIIGTYPSMIIPFKFVPSSDIAGTASYSSTQGIITVSGSGTYTIEGSDTDSPKIVWRVTMTMSGPGISRTQTGTADININLVPLNTTECDGQ